MEDNIQDLQKQLSDAKEQLNWLRKNFNEEINILIKENRELKEQLKITNEVKVNPTNIDTPNSLISKDSITPQDDGPKLQTQAPKVTTTETPITVTDQAPDEISSLRWVIEWAICKFKDWFIRLPCTLALLIYHIFAIQYHKHLCNKR